MAFTARLNPEVEAQAKGYAQSVGISLNALLSVALREYLDARHGMRSSGGRALRSPAPPVVEAVASPLALDLAVPVGKSYAAPKSRSDPCPCGARNAQGFRLKWKQCHGLPGRQ